MTLTRRELLRGTAAATALGLVGVGTAGCGGLSPGRDSSGSLDYWNLFGGGDGVRMNQMLDGFRTANPGIELSAVTLAWGNPYYTKLSLATLGEKPPDVAVAHLTRMKNLVAADLLEELRPEDLAGHGISADKFTERAWQAGLVDGRAYAIPIDTHPFVMFYNTDICDKAGLLDTAGALTPLDTPEKFTDAMRRAKEASGGYGGVVSINNDTSTPWRIFQSLYGQLGGETLADEGRRVVIDDAKATQVLTFLRSLTHDGLFPADIDYQGAIATFANGQAGFYFQGEWEISTFQTAKMPFSMTLFPNLYGGTRYAVQADSHTLVIPRQPARDPEQVNRSLLLVRSMLDQSKTWAEGGHVPAWLPFRDSAEYKGMTPQSNYAAAADGAVYDPDGWYSGSGSNFEIVAGSAIATVLAGQRAPADALAQMRGQLENLSTTASPI
ncbi:extracellular solute-binding protein [Actinoplanes sp. NPDC026623]|uniref:extracellular solute-binding protein n=1 Tax=Actinoplanes sp. NPDC026623 TaxID=3155610 RepID=UPI0034060B75